MPEITIGNLNNVPDHSPLTSPWAHDVTRLGIHYFPTKAALDAAPGLVPAAGRACWAFTTDFNRLWYRESTGPWHNIEIQAARTLITTNGAGGFSVYFPHPFLAVPAVSLNGSGVSTILYVVAIIDDQRGADHVGCVARDIADGGAPVVSKTLAVYWVGKAEV